MAPWSLKTVAKRLMRNDEVPVVPVNGEERRRKRASQTNLLETMGPEAPADLLRKLRGQKHYLDITPEPSQLAPSQINQKVYLFTRERNKFWITVTCVVNTDRDGVEGALSENKSQRTGIP